MDSSSFGLFPVAVLAIATPLTVAIAKTAHTANGLFQINHTSPRPQFYNKIILEVRMNAIKKHTLALEVAKSAISMDEVPGKSLISEDEWKKIAAMVKLTDRERQVCRFVFEGHTRKEVAESMGISTRTVRHYLESVHTKLSVNGRVGVVLRLVQMRDLLAEQETEQACQLRVGPSIPPQR